MVKINIDEILENLDSAIKNTVNLSNNISKSEKEVIKSLTAVQSISETTGLVTVQETTTAAVAPDFLKTTTAGTWTTEGKETVLNGEGTVIELTTGQSTSEATGLVTVQGADSAVTGLGTGETVSGAADVLLTQTAVTWTTDDTKTAVTEAS